MNQKLSRLMEPNWKLYFAVLGLYALLAIPFQPWLAAAELAAAIGLYAWFVRSSRARQKKILQYIDSITGSVDTASKSTLINSPLPIMVFRPDTGEVIWSNEDFLQLAGVREHLFEMKVDDAVPHFPTSWLLEGKSRCPDRVEMNGRRFQVYGSLQRAKGRSAQGLVATTYWVDVTESDSLRERYSATRPVMALIQVDNYDDLMKACPDTQRSAILAQIDEKLGQWTEGVGVLVKTQRDHYLFLFEEEHFEHFAAEKFAVLDSIRAVKVAEGLNPTLSIGVGKDADSIAELYKGANLSLEMALSRGGDQAVVRTRQDFSFYGGRTKTAEKRTKVKSRVMANALGELMEDAATPTWTPWARRRALCASPGSGGARPRSSSTRTTTPPSWCWRSCGSCRSTPGRLWTSRRLSCGCSRGPFLSWWTPTARTSWRPPRCWRAATGWRSSTTTAGPRATSRTPP